MQVTALKLHDVDFGDQWSSEAEDHWLYDDFKRNDDWRTGWISFDCAAYDAPADRLYLGITSFDADIFKAYDRGTGTFVGLGYDRIADPFDAKFHRSLVRASDGTIYGAVALLHCLDHQFDAPGGAIVKYEPASGEISKLCVPVPHGYIQSITLDEERNTIYGLCFPPECLISHHLGTGEVKMLGMIGTGIGGMTQGENLVLDDDGCVWSNWSLTRAWQSGPGPDMMRLCKYDPDADRIVFFQKGLPQPDGSYGYAKSEGLFNFGDGCLYASGGNGSLYRVDPETGDAEWLFTPTPDRPSRLSSLVKAEEGVAYGVTGRNNECELMRADYAKGTFEKLGKVEDPDGTTLYQNHDIVMANDGVLYICENDTPRRSSYLWEVKI